MLVFHRILIASTCLLSLAFAQTTPTPDHYAQVAKTVGYPGTLNADGSFRINIARTDVKFVNSRGMDISPDLGLATYIAFSGTADKALAVGDVAMLEPEIDGVLDALRAGKFEIVSLHNHMTSEKPRLFYVHFQGFGTTAELATGFKKVVDQLGAKLKIAKAPKRTKPTLDPVALAGIFGSKADVKPSGVIRFSFPRKDLKVTVDDMAFVPGMGLASWAAFSACGCGLTMVMGDTCCTRSELQGAIDALRAGGIHITAIHNHIFGGNQEVAFMHYEGEDDSLKLATVIKNAWRVLGK